MLVALSQLNYVAVLGTAVVGFLIGWLWYSPVLFAKSWMAEMKITPEKMKDAAARGMAKFLVAGFVYTVLSTVGLATLLKARGTTDCLHGAEFGAFVGLLIAGTRMANAGVWEQRSLKLLSITIGYEVVMFSVQGAILVCWQ